MHALRKGSEHIESTSVGMSQRKKRQSALCAGKQFGINAEANISGKIFSREHHTFGESGGAGGVVDLYHLGVVSVGILNILRSIALGIFFIEATFQKLQVSGELDLRNLMKRILFVDSCSAREPDRRM